MLRVYNATARYVDQGGNKRPGAFAIYLEPWHSDVYDFLELRKNTGKEEQVKKNWMIFIINFLFSSKFIVEVNWVLCVTLRNFKQI